MKADATKLGARSPAWGLSASSQSEYVAFLNSCANFLRDPGLGILD